MSKRVSASKVRRVLHLGTGTGSSCSPSFPGDAQKLFRDCSVSLRNAVDVGVLACLVDAAPWIVIPQPRPPKPTEPSRDKSDQVNATKPKPRREPRLSNDNAAASDQASARVDQAATPKTPRPPKPPADLTPYLRAPGLGRLVEHYLRRCLSKPKRVQISNWEKVPLAIEQQHCACKKHALATLFVVSLTLSRGRCRERRSSRPGGILDRHGHRCHTRCGLAARSARLAGLRI